ncbi:MAG: DUF192 domain-containing protein [Terracidiphilus sp.]|nr:DUF192 domain-containing protein [Terracidiphilus sp.]
MQIVNETRKTVLASNAEVADTPQRRSKGLLGRNGLGPGGALWIVPCESVHTFWMKFDLDLIYIDRRYRVVKIRTGVPPWRLSACLKAHSIIEFQASALRDTGTLPGDQLAFVPVSSPESGTSDAIWNQNKQ